MASLEPVYWRIVDKQEDYYSSRYFHRGALYCKGFEECYPENDGET